MTHLGRTSPTRKYPAADVLHDLYIPDVIVLRSVLVQKLWTGTTFMLFFEDN